MLFNAQDVIARLERMGVKFSNNPQIKAQLIQHLAHPETKAQIAQNAKLWKASEPIATMASAVIFLSKQNAVSDIHAIMLHEELGRELRKEHTLGGRFKGMVTRAAAAFKAQQKRKAYGMGRQRRMA